jgi:hypothetical protein
MHERILNGIAIVCVALVLASCANGYEISKHIVVRW